MPEVSCRTLGIDRVERLTRGQFERDYVNRNRPVLIRGAVNHWPAMTKWTPEYLDTTAGKQQVSVRFEEAGDFHRYWAAARPQLHRVSFGEHLGRMLADPPDTRHYMLDYPLRSVSGRLAADVDGNDYVLRGPSTPKLFLGRNSYTGLHYHGNAESLMCLVVGRKHVTLHPPTDWSSLYSYAWYRSPMNFSRVDGRDPDLSRFPKYRRTHPIRVTMEAGDALFTPLHWWHAVDSPGYSIGVSFFWRARWRRFHFPSPGISICLHSLFAPVSIRAVGRRVHRRLREVVQLRTRLRAARSWVGRRVAAAPPN